MWFLPQHPAILALGCTIAMLAACAPPPHTIATFHTEYETISLQQAPNGGAYSVTVGATTSLSLDNYTSARICGIVAVPGANLVIISGADADCLQRYALVVAINGSASLHPIGECGDAYSFARDGDALDIRQSGVRDPIVWTFRDGELDGPTVEITPRPHHRRHASASHPIDHTGDDPPEPAAPAVSPPVGDEVIPSPFGRSASSGSRRNDAPLF
jgi:hypothetical protein